MEKLNSYSQHGEDDLVWKFFDRKNSGLIIEVGAFDGIHFSNSLALEKLGWKTVLVEPHPSYFPLVEKNRPNALKFNCAAVGDESITEISFVAEELGLLSGIDVDLEDIQRRYTNRGLDFKAPEKVAVHARTLNSIFRELNISPGDIDCITIDVEGAEMEVLKGFDIEYYQPKVLIIESNTPQTTEALDGFFEKSNGYKKARSMKVNLIYVLGAENVSKLNSIVIDCDTADQKHPLGDEYTVNAKIDTSKKTESKPRLIDRLKNLFR